METLRQESHENDIVSSPSPEMFSFPGTPTDVDGGDPTKNSVSPADQFFINGRLLPHNFPISQTRNSFSGRDNVSFNNNNNNNNLSRGTSLGSSVSKDSLMSSRSNSTNSTCSSARTSSSEVSERKTFQKRNVSGLVNNYQYNKYGGGGLSSSSQRWQFITPAPMLGPSSSRRGRREGGVGPTMSPRQMKEEGKIKGSGNNNNNNKGEGFFQRILRSFVATCKACHAMEDQENNEFDLLDGDLCAVGN